MNVIPFKIVPLGNYTDGAALEVLNRYGLQHVRYTVNHFFYKDVLERLRKRIIRVRPDIAVKWMLHHDNAPCHTALSVTEFFTSKGIPVILQPPIHLISAPFFFLKLKTVLRGRHFGT